jgi:hopanoid biosynthesis associated protein HpnK
MTHMIFTMISSRQVSHWFHEVRWMKTYAIVNADDFGLAPGINRGIIEAHCQGIVTSASLMPTGDGFDEAIALAHRHADLAIGVHLTLVEGRPVLPAARIPSLVTASGGFIETPWGFLKRWATGQIQLDDVKKELEAQVAKVADQGIRIDKLDSHMHLHLLPGIFQTAIAIGKTHQIKGIRLPREQLRWRGFGRLAGSMKQLVLGCLARLQARRVSSSGLFCPDYLCGIAESGQMTEEALLRALSSLRPGVTEIMVHPGYPDDQMEGWPLSRRYRRQKELIALTSTQITELVKLRQIELVSYCTVHREMTGKARR